MTCSALCLASLARLSDLLPISVPVPYHNPIHPQGGRRRELCEFHAVWCLESGHAALDDTVRAALDPLAVPEWTLSSVRDIPAAGNFFLCPQRASPVAWAAIGVAFDTPYLVLQFSIGYSNPPFSHLLRAHYLYTAHHLRARLTSSPRNTPVTVGDEA
jgi:hypothetical protein